MDFTLFSPRHVYLACGYTDMRKSIDGLASLSTGGAEVVKQLRWLMDRLKIYQPKTIKASHPTRII